MLICSATSTNIAQIILFTAVDRAYDTSRQPVLLEAFLLIFVRSWVTMLSELLLLLLLTPYQLQLGVFMRFIYVYIS